MSTIWIFREPRVGGTAFSNLLSRQLNKQLIFVDQDMLVDNPPASTNTLYNVVHPLSCDDILYNTHDFNHLKYMDLYKDPFLIRMYRQNKVEQCFSRLLSEWMLVSKFKYVNNLSQWFFNKFSDNSNTELLSAFNTLEPTVLPKATVIKTLTDMSTLESLWNQHAINYKSVQISYEEMCLGLDIPEIGLYSLQINETSRTQKLPNIHKQVFINYDLIVKWIHEFYNL
jgi:hypothetical protein